MASLRFSILIDSGSAKAFVPSNASCAAMVSVRATAKYSALVELSQSAKSAMKSSNALRNSTPSSRQPGVLTILLNRG